MNKAYNFRRVINGVTALLLIALSPAFATTNDDASCNPLRLHHCALPFPSDFYTVTDELSATGVRTSVPSEIFSPEVLAELPESVHPANVYGQSNGFSAMSAVLFEMPSFIDGVGLPSNAREAVIAVDLTTGERLSVYAQPSKASKGPELPDNGMDEVLEVWPRARWPFGHRIAVGVTRHLRTALGASMPVSEQFSAATQDTSSNIYGLISPALQAFATHGINTEDLVNVTAFTVRTESDVTDTMLRWSENVYAQEHPVRNISVKYNLFSSMAAQVTGEVRLSDFRSDEGGMRYITGDKGDEYWTEFKLYLPRLSKGGSAPVVVYGHGVSLYKETAKNFVVDKNVEKKIATIAIDLPNHGSRIDTDGGYVFEKVSPAGVPALTGVITQSTIDNVALVKAIETSLANLDVLPHKLNSHLKWENGDGTPDLDVSDLYYEGSSVGGALGTAFAAISPSIKGAFFQAPGFGIMRTLSTSWFWDIKAPPLPIKGFGNAVPKIARGADAVMLVAVVQHMLDTGDGANYTHLFKNPLPGYSVRPLAMVYGMKDGLAPNHCSESLIRISGMPLVSPLIEPLENIQVKDDLDNGFGALQLIAPDGDPTLHFVFGKKEADDFLYRWIDQVVYKGKTAPVVSQKSTATLQPWTFDPPGQ